MTTTTAPLVRRLDHVALAVWSTDAAVATLAERFELRVIATEENRPAHARLTWLDCGNACLQLVEPLSDDAPVARFLEAHGEGIHHICFAVDDPVSAAMRMGDGSPVTRIGSGRGKVAAFVPGAPILGATFECTEFVVERDLTRELPDPRRPVQQPAPDPGGTDHVRVRPEGKA